MQKTIGVTTLASTGGGAVGFFVAQFIVDIFHLSLTDGGQMGLGLLLVAVGSLIGGYLSPSKSAELAKVFAQVNVPTADEIATAVSEVAATPADVQNAVNALPSHADVQDIVTNATAPAEPVTEIQDSEFEPLPISLTEE